MHLLKMILVGTLLGVGRLFKCVKWIEVSSTWLTLIFLCPLWLLCGEALTMVVNYQILCQRKEPPVHTSIYRESFNPFKPIIFLLFNLPLLETCRFYWFSSLHWKEYITITVMTTTLRFTFPSPFAFHNLETVFLC